LAQRHPPAWRNKHKASEFFDELPRHLNEIVMFRKIVIALAAGAVIAFVPAGASARGGLGGGGFHGGFGGGGWRGGGFRSSTSNERG
jgi:hypothetical protein